MHAQALKTSLCTDVCIFCATRLQFASSRSSTRFQRRPFRSTAAVWRPPASAVAQEVEHEEEQSTQNNWQPTQRGFTRRDNGWGSRVNRGFTSVDSASRESRLQDARLSSRETAERSSATSSSRPLQHDALRPRPFKSLYRDTPSAADNEEQRQVLQQELNENNGSYQPNWICMDCGRKNFRRDHYCQRCEAPATPRADWRCQQCKSINDVGALRCRQCNPQTGLNKRQDISNPAHHWQHLRRSGSKVSSQQVRERAQEVSQPSRETQDAYAQARAAEAERQQRWKEAESGGYVGFRKIGVREAPAAPVSFSIRKSLSERPAPSSDEKPPDSAMEDELIDVNPALSFDTSLLEEAQPRTKQRRFGPDREGHRNVPHDRNRHKARSSNFRRSGQEAFDEVDDDMIARKQDRKEQRKKAKEEKKQAAPPTQIYLPEFISVSNLAGVLRVRVEDFLKKMSELGFDDLHNDHVLDAETAGLVAAEFNFEAIIDRQEEQDLKPQPPTEDRSLLPARPPVVTIMGHVDHGKTTLLDYLRKSSIAASEHGGITQHIGAFSVPMPGGRLVTFLDTPGHAAFLAMRQRGANVTDIVILVVAADDSVKPQTVEAIKHAQSAKVPMIVAINKVDKEDSNIDRVKQDLARYGVEIEDYGGDTQVVCVSGKTGQGMEELEDAAVALADIIDMRAETDGQAEGWVLEATTKKAGRVATVLVRRGTLRPGDVIVAGVSWARVRCLRNEAGVMIPEAGPGTPVEVDGWREQPSAGDEMLQAPDEQKAKSVIEYRKEGIDRTQMAVDIAAVNESRRIEQEKREQLEKATTLAATPAEQVSPSTDSEIIEETKPETSSFQEVFFILKADVSGSLEAVTNAVSALGNSEVQPRILRSGVGTITEFDIDHAAVAKGHIISFNTVVDGSTRREAEDKSVKIIDQSIIYRLVDDVKAVLGEKLPDVITQKVVGEAEVAQVFDINIKGRMTVPVAGCRVRNGIVSKGSKIRVLRGKETVYDGILSSLKNVKKDVTEMRKGTECGMGFDNWTDFKVGDQIQTYEESVEKRTL